MMIKLECRSSQASKGSTAWLHGRIAGLSPVIMVPMSSPPGSLILEEPVLSAPSIWFLFSRGQLGSYVFALHMLQMWGQVSENTYVQTYLGHLIDDPTPAKAWGLGQELDI